MEANNDAKRPDGKCPTPLSSWRPCIFSLSSHSNSHDQLVHVLKRMSNTG